MGLDFDDIRPLPLSGCVDPETVLAFGENKTRISIRAGNFKSTQVAIRFAEKVNPRLRDRFT